MSDGKQPRSGAPEKDPPSPAPPDKRRLSVFIYLAILFAAAFLLLLFAYLMQQRNSAEILGSLIDLRDSVTSFQSLDEVLDDNRLLREENEELQARIEELETQLESAQSAYEVLEGGYSSQTMQASMLETLYFAELKLAQDDPAGAAAVLAGFDTSELEAEIARYDAQMSHSHPEYALLALRYQELTEALIDEGYLFRDSGGNLAVPAVEEE